MGPSHVRTVNAYVAAALTAAWERLCLEGCQSGSGSSSAHALSLISRTTLAALGLRPMLQTPMVTEGFRALARGGAPDAIDACLREAVFPRLLQLASAAQGSSAAMNSLQTGCDSRETRAASDLELVDVDGALLPRRMRNCSAFEAALALARTAEAARCFSPSTTGPVRYERLGAWKDVFAAETAAIQACTLELGDGDPVPPPPELDLPHGTAGDGAAPEAAIPSTPSTQAGRARRAVLQDGSRSCWPRGSTSDSAWRVYPSISLHLVAASSASQSPPISSIAVYTCASCNASMPHTEGCACCSRGAGHYFSYAFVSSHPWRRITSSSFVKKSCSATRMTLWQRCSHFWACKRPRFRLHFSLQAPWTLGLQSSTPCLRARRAGEPREITRRCLKGRVTRSAHSSRRIMPLSMSILGSTWGGMVRGHPRCPQAYPSLASEDSEKHDPQTIIYLNDVGQLWQGTRDAAAP